MATTAVVERATSSDHVFDDLYGKIIRLELLPGTKLSETEVAKSYGYSRQPVREAFTRLAQVNLLLIRPQRATIVRHFSHEIIDNARFARTAIELEVLRTAVLDRDKAQDARLKENLKRQSSAIGQTDAKAFHDLDYEFHKLICLAARKEFAFEIIAANKAQVDRLCMLSLTSKAAMEALYADHEEIVTAIFEKDTVTAERVLRLHLDRLNPTIEAIYTTHRDYFDS